MTGRTVQVRAPHPDVQYTLQGVATLDRDKRQARALFGGSGGAADLVFANVPAEIFGGTVHARLHEIPWTGQVGASAQPLRIKDLELPVDEGRVVALADLDAMSAYEVILSPGGDRVLRAALHRLAPVVPRGARDLHGRGARGTGPR